MKLSLIVAVSMNSVIGKNNRLPWNIPSDLKHFKEFTMGKAVLMGRKTFESLPTLLEGRTTIVVSSNYDAVKRKVDKFKLDNPNKELPDVIHATSIAHLFSCDVDTLFEEIVVAGGSTIYKQLYPFVDSMTVTMVDTDVMKGDTLFPIKINWGDWTITDDGQRQHFDGDEFPYFIKTYQRKKKDDNIFDFFSKKKLSKLDVIRKKLGL
jgi:dihydrofolate reductase